MCANFGIVLARQRNSLAHRAGITCMAAAGDICGIDQGHDAFVVTHFPWAKAFAHIAV